MTMNRETDEAVLARVRQSILKVFGRYISEDVKTARRIIEQSTFTGKDDPGGWSRNAAVIIHTESGIPNGSWDTRMFEKWFSVSELLTDHFCEHVNGAVIGVYRN